MKRPGDPDFVLRSFSGDGAFAPCHLYTPRLLSGAHRDEHAEDQAPDLRQGSVSSGAQIGSRPSLAIIPEARDGGGGRANERDGLALRRRVLRGNKSMGSDRSASLRPLSIGSG